MYECPKCSHLTTYDIVRTSIHSGACMVQDDDGTYRDPPNDYVIRIMEKQVDGVLTGDEAVDMILAYHGLPRDVEAEDTPKES